MNLEEIEKRGKRTIYHCKDCNKTVNVYTQSVVLGHKPCACGRSYYNTPQKRLFKILDYCSKNGYTLVDYVDNPTVARESRVTVKQISCGHIYETSYRSFFQKKRSCHGCNITSPKPKELREKQFQDICSKKNFTYSLVDNGVRNFNRIEISCLDCGLVKTPEIAYFIRDDYSCECKRDLGFKDGRPAHFYILHIQSKDKEENFLKVGISKKLDKRISHLKNDNPRHKIKLLFNWVSQGNLCREFEFLCKKKYPRPETTLISGFTETVRYKDLPFLLEDAEEFFGCKGSI